MPAKNKPQKRKKQEEPRASFKERLSEALELPKEIVLNVPKLIMVGNSDLIIENFKGIIEYEADRIRLNTGVGVLKITGSRLAIREITSEDMMVSGDIRGLEFMK